MKIRLITLLTFLSLQFAVKAQEFETQTYDLPSDTKHAVLTDTEKAEPSVLLLDKNIYEYRYNKDGDLESVYTKHRKIHINDAAEVEHYNRIYFPVNNPESILSLRLRSVTKSGKITEMKKSDLKKITEDDHDYMILAVEGLEKDAELEYFFTIKRGVTYFLTEFAQSGTFIRHAEVQVISPANLIWEAKTYNGEMAVTDTVINDKRILKYTRENVPVLDSEEKYAAYTANRQRIEFKLARNTSGSNLRLFTWGDAGKRYYEIMHEEEKSAHKDIEKLSSQLSLKKLSSDEARIRAIENFIKMNININEQAEVSGIPELLKKHYGSENQVVSLYILMLENANIPHELVVTTSRFDAWFDPEFDTWNFLDSYLLFFPATGKYMDPTNILYRYGEVPYEFINNNGLFVKKVSIGAVSNGVSVVKKIEGVTYTDNFNKLNAEITFEKNMDEVKIISKQEYGGNADNLYRTVYFYSDAESRSKMIDEIIKSNFNDMKTTDTKVSNFDLTKDEYSKPFIVETTVNSPSLMQHAGTDVVFSIGDVIGQQVEMYQEHARQNPIDVGFPHYYERVLVVTVPKGYEVKGLEKLEMDIVFNDLGTGFTSSYKRDGDKIIVTVNEFYKNVQLPVSAFDNFKKVINAAADFNKIKLVFVKS
ncbi:MAG TPA: DUF3857 domain-containing protein [Bacteroidia bacterium]|nr:DUF3857 domain-containing protein [Bacteroidia bacterium]